MAFKGQVRQLNNSVYELYKPPGEPDMQVIFFHGLHLGDSKKAHLWTWTSEDGSSLWPQTWLVEEFPGAQVLSVSFDGIQTNRNRAPGRHVDIMLQNLMADLLGAEVSARCPVILVGHSFGGLLMKAVCVHFGRGTMLKAGYRGPAQYANFLKKVKACFFYSTPHYGVPFEEVKTGFLSKTSFRTFVSVLRVDWSSAEFDILAQKCDWLVSGVGEGLPTKLSPGGRASLLVSEASSRYADFSIIANADHFAICKPKERSSTSFKKLIQLLRIAVPIHQLGRIPKYAPGLEKQVRAIQELLKNAVAVGISGMGGVGKTTIAKEVFSQISRQFEYTNFFENVRDIPINELDDRLCTQFYYRGVKVPDQGQGQIKWSFLKEKKTLIVMDDIDSKDQLGILPRLQDFGTGSRLIITSRDQGILMAFEEFPMIYEVDFLGVDEAKRLLCVECFGQEGIPEHLLHLQQSVQTLVEKCEGLPLTIEVAGHYLRGHDNNALVWEETIHKLGKAQTLDGDSTDRLWASLRVSYDSLLEEEQNVFIEAATYFHGQPVEQALAAWDGVYGTSRVIWANLLRRSMVREVNKATWDSLREREILCVTVWVHEQLRDLAASLSRVKSRSGNVNWLRANASILQLPSGDEKCITASPGNQLILPKDLLHEFENLKYLDLEDVMIKGQLLKMFPNRLSLLRWKIRSMSQLPRITTSKMKNLTVLELANWKIPKDFPRTLENLTNLHILYLCQLEGLEQLPENFGKLYRLKRLELVGLTFLVLPESFGNLMSLEHLALDSLIISALPESFGNLSSLRTLTIRNCEKLKSLPLSFGRLDISRGLVLEGCGQLERFPDTEELPALQHLTLVNAPILAFFESLRMLSALKHLTLVNVSISEFPESFLNLSSLLTLTIVSCSDLVSLPGSLGRLSSLERLYIHNCPKLSSLPDSLGYLSFLKELYIYNCPVVRTTAAEAIVQAYYENETLTADLHVDWTEVGDPSLRKKLELYRDRNLRLKDLTKKLKAPKEDDKPEEDEKKAKQETELKDEEMKEGGKVEQESKLNENTSNDRLKMGVEDHLPLTCAKIFLCGYPEVGKTTLRKTLQRSIGRWTKFKWERGPKLIKQRRTRGIEIRCIEKKTNNGDSMSLKLWDLAGHVEYHVLHGSFFASQGLAGGKATSFVLVFKATFEKAERDHLLYWLRFVASGSHGNRHVVIVLNRFGFNFGCRISNEEEKWKDLIAEYRTQFSKVLYIHAEPFIIDVRVASMVEPLKNHLFDLVQRLLKDVRLPSLCVEMQAALKVLPRNKLLPILTWQAFEEALNLNSEEELLRLAASYLHEIGEIIYFGKEESAEPRSEDRITVVPDPEWFCKEVVGQLLLPSNLLERRSRQRVITDGTIPITFFESFFGGQLDQAKQRDDLISLLEYLGLCYKMKDGEQDKDVKLIVPARISGDFEYSSMGWDNKRVAQNQGAPLVMGRCLVVKDRETHAIPMTVFRQLQVYLAKDEGLGGCADSEYKLGRSFSCFKVDALLVLVQFGEADANPNDNRVDILVKSQIEPADLARQIKRICKIMEKLQELCASCCPGVKYDIKVIEPWIATKPTPKMIARKVGRSVKEIQNLLKKSPDEYSTWQPAPDNPLWWKSFLSDTEQDEIGLKSPEERLKKVAEQEYDDCKRDALTMGLIEKASLEEFEQSEELNSSNVQSIDRRGLAGDLRVHELEKLVEGAVSTDGRETRKLVEKNHKELVSLIQKNHGLLARQIQAQQAELFEEIANRVPRFMFLVRKKDGILVKLKEVLRQEVFLLHLLCEAHVDTGTLHEVKDQEGITITASPEVLRKYEPWIRWSLQVAVTVGKSVGNTYLPGVFKFIPDGLTLPQFVDKIVPLILKDDKGLKHVQDGAGNIGTSTEPVKLGLIAREAVKRLIDRPEFKGPEFKKKTKLTRVLLPQRSLQPSVGNSKQGQSSVVWVCFECREKYKDRAIDA